MAAHEHARRLDPKAVTSVVNTYFHQRDYVRVLEAGDSGAPYLEGIALAELGRADEGITLLREVGQKAPPRMRDFMEAAVALIEGHSGIDADALAAIERTFFKHVSDPEGLYYASRHLAKVGETDVALRELRRAVDGGFFCYPAFRTDTWFEKLRGHEAFELSMQRAKERHLQAIAAFKGANGERIVGVRMPAAD